MTLVTITDHNRIEGALEIAPLPDAFVSEEITTYFPEDRCKIHVLALNIDEDQHRDIQQARENIYDLVDYLLEAGIFHILAHPLYSVNERLTITHFEKLLLLFKNFEMNGARNDQTNACLHSILRQLTPADIERLADAHGITPRMKEPWRKNITGGSDDHSSLNIARTYTEKSLALLTEVFKILSRAENGLHLIVTGAGSMAAGLRRLLGTAPCSFLERPTEEEWPGICASSDIFISRGRGREAVKAVSEAQASGVPVIVEDLNQLKGCISPERSGIVVKPKDADSLYEALQRLISSEDSRRRMGRSARRFAESSATVWTAFTDPHGTNPSQEVASPVRLAGGM